jgi:hypothetical protein
MGCRRALSPKESNEGTAGRKRNENAFSGSIELCES